MSAIVMLGIALFLALIVANYITRNRRWFKCAYCERYFSDCGDITNERPAEATDPLSHGACEECGEQLLRDAEAQFGTGQSQPRVTCAMCIT